MCFLDKIRPCVAMSILCNYLIPDTQYTVPRNDARTIPKWCQNDSRMDPKTIL